MSTDKIKIIKYTILEDMRDTKIEPFENRRYRLNNSQFYSKQLIKEYYRIRNAIIEYQIGESIHLISNKYNISKDSLRTYSKKILYGSNMNDILKMNIGYPGELGLEIAEAELKIFSFFNHKLPTQREMNAIVKCIYKKKYWRNFGINTWNDLSKHVFNETNSKQTTLRGRSGLEKAKNSIIKYYEKHGKPPTAHAKVMSQFVNFIYRKKWYEFNIRSWNDLLEFSIGFTNKKNKIYIGEDGLNRAKAELKKYHNEYKSKPKATDKGMLSIATAIKRRYWIDFEIHSWNDLMTSVFGKPNRKYRIWTGEQGLKRAKNIIEDYFKMYKRRPRNRDKNMSGIVSAIKRKYWKDYGIISWTQLVNEVIEPLLRNE